MGMPDSNAKRAWMKENTVYIGLKFMRRTEADMIDYLDQQMEKGKAKSAVIKAALREYMENHKDKS